LISLPWSLRKQIKAYLMLLHASYCKTGKLVKKTLSNWKWFVKFAKLFITKVFYRIVIRRCRCSFSCKNIIGTHLLLLLMMYSTKSSSLFIILNGTTYKIYKKSYHNNSIAQQAITIVNWHTRQNTLQLFSNLQRAHGMYHTETCGIFSC